ncbi:hypothetical protein H920_04914 [Fukomys damarensis]|uniref:Uncharacterized protein n=1 Tax=Fukomys damarensis TaxID=885580 RepID=A0A091DNH2_FUKDA|nr:hypothetical protein H920_04914 [Fukomys damarensis]
MVELSPHPVSGEQLVHHIRRPSGPSSAPWRMLLFLCHSLHLSSMTVKGEHLESVQDTEAITTALLKTIGKEDFQNCLTKRQG